MINKYRNFEYALLVLLLLHTPLQVLAKSDFYQCTLTKELKTPDVPEKILHEFEIFYSSKEGTTEYEFLPFDFDNYGEKKVGLWCSQFDRQHSDQLDRYIHCGFFMDETGKPRKRLQNIYTLWGILGGFSIYKWDAPSPSGEVVLKLVCDYNSTE